MPDQKQDESFKVIDRRLFSPEGEIRDEAIRDERRKQESEIAPAGASGNAAAGAQREAAGRQGAKPDAASPSPSSGAQANAPAPSHGIQMLINFVAQNAAMLLGAYPDPRSGQAMVDLEAAREFIDMLDALREGTRGNLAAEDERLLLDVIGSLKLSFMEMTKAAAKVAKEKAKARP